METAHRLTEKKAKRKEKSTGFENISEVLLKPFFDSRLAVFWIVLDLFHSRFGTQNFMPKRKKYKKSKEEILEDSKEKSPDVQNTNSNENDLAKQIKKAVANLYYISETDAEILPFTGEQAEVITKEEILSQTKNAADVPVEVRDFAEFFARLTKIQDWFGDEEKETTQKFARLKELLEKNLRDLKVFKLGKIQLDVYVVGLDAESKLIGIKTEAVET